MNVNVNALPEDANDLAQPVIIMALLAICQPNSLFYRDFIGGGVADEGEDITVLEIDFAKALAMINNGEICDGKTIMLLQYAALNLFNHRRVESA